VSAWFGYRGLFRIVREISCFGRLGWDKKSKLGQKSEKMMRKVEVLFELITQSYHEKNVFRVRAGHGHRRERFLALFAPQQQNH
jgi:hypothetical protein